MYATSGNECYAIDVGARDLQTGKFIWELSHPDAAIPGEARSLQRMAFSSCATIAGPSWASTPRRAGVLWQYQVSQLWKASPMTYQFVHKQYVAVAAGQNVFAFGLTQ
jgi:alcohol dehydrogenase (cytochrome c)